MRRAVVVTTLIIALGLVNWGIYQKEQHLAKGQLVLLKLAPVDPRSLMQGDYMTLNFTIARQIRQALRQKRQQNGSSQRGLDAADGYVVVSVNEHQVASFVGLHGTERLADDQQLLFYRVRADQVKFATNAFFFEEGSGEEYQSAEYGGFRVNADGELLLQSMFDKDLKQLGTGEPKSERSL